MYDSISVGKIPKVTEAYKLKFILNQYFHARVNKSLLLTRLGLDNGKILRAPGPRQKGGPQFTNKSEMYK